MKSPHSPVITEQTFNTSIEDVWSAITDQDQLIQWFFDNIPDFQPVVGFETQFLIQNEDRRFTHLWKIIEVIPNQKIAYSWSFEEYSGDSYVTFELKQEGDQTKLIHTHTVTESFPEGIPEFERESGVQGWAYFIKGRLKEYLERS